MIPVLNTGTPNPSLAVSVGEEGRGEFGVASTRLLKEDAGDAADRVTDATIAEVDFSIERIPRASYAIVDDGLVVTASGCQGRVLDN